jgi:hypothetical protein
MKFLEIARLILSLLPVLIQAIRAAEEAIPGEGKGEAKLAMIRGILEAAYSTATDALGTFDQLWPALQSTISAVVQAFNKAKVFPK